MQNRKNQTSVGLMIQRCHKWRQRRKQHMDQARSASDTIERERFLQMAEHYGRIVSYEQGKINSTRDPKDKLPVVEDTSKDNDGGAEIAFADFVPKLK